MYGFAFYMTESDWNSCDTAIDPNITILYRWALDHMFTVRRLAATKQVLADMYGSCRQ